MKYTATYHLQARIDQLDAERKKLEQLILKDVKAVSETIRHPAPYIRSTLAELASDRSFFADLVSVLLQYLTSYLAGKFGRSMAKSSFFSELFNSPSGENDSSGLINLLKKVFKSRGETRDNKDQEGESR